MQNNDRYDLKGVNVLVTRPVEQAAQLVKRVEQHGGNAILLPLIKIEPIQNPAAAEELSRLVDYDAVIFVSANAVRHALPFMTLSQLKQTRIGAIGRGTARQLEDAGITVTMMPEHAFDTEGFLARDDVQDMTAKRVLIVRGDGGREKLATTLQARGAEVDYAEVYRRVRPDVLISSTVEHANVDVITLTSSVALNNLAVLAREQNQNWVFEKPLIVIHDRIAECAIQAGFKQPALVTTEVSDEAIISQLVQWKKSQGV